MKLPRDISKRRKFTLYIISLYILISVMFAPITQTYASSIMANKPSQSIDSTSPFNGDSYTEINLNPSTKLDIRPEEVGFPYDPVSSSSGSGDNFNIRDDLIYTDSHSLNIRYNLNYPTDPDTVSDSYTVSDLGYTDDSLEYDITSITATTDYYPLESNVDQSLSVELTNDLIPIYAQGFEVKWDYANFTQAKIYLYGEPGLSGDRVELLIVSDDGTGKPDQTNILASMGPYEPRTLPASTWPEMPVFDFSDLTLTKGNYFVIANLTTFGGSGAPHALWYYNNTHDDGLAFRSFSNSPGSISWASFPNNLALSVELLPVNSTYDALEFSSPDQIDLTDNSSSITTNKAILSGTFTGDHLLEANTSVDISFTTNYVYYTTHTASSFYSITNSTFDQMSIDWNITWSTLAASTTYTLVDRNMTVYIPQDWSGTFNWYQDEATPFTFEKLVDYYIVYLGTDTNAANWRIATTSPNHMYSVVFSDGATETERFYLGYWDTDTVDAYGHEGSSVYVEADVKYDVGVLTNDTTGTLDYTLYDPDGNIVSVKSVSGNLSYTDTSSYTITDISNIAGGYFNEYITFDPSVYGSDKPGFWTAEVTWKNGTEIGYYSQRIIVQSQTDSDFEWEIIPNSDTWVQTDITRKGDDSFIVQGYYYNVSEPFFTSVGELIPDAQVSYTVSNATWNKNGNFNDYAPFYNSSILVDFAVGDYIVDVQLTGAFLEEQSVSFNVSVFYELALVPEYTSTSTYYTDNVVFNIALYDVTADKNLTDTTTISDLNITLYDGNSYFLTSPTDYTFTYTGAPEEWVLDISTATNNLDIGWYDVYIEVLIDDYQESYTNTYVSDVYSFEILAAETEIQIDIAPTTIQVYHDALFYFRYYDTTHNLNLSGAVIAPSANASNIDLAYTTFGNGYRLTVTNNNDTVTDIQISITVTLANYESQIDFVLGDLEVLIINTELAELSMYTPTVSYVGYETTVVVQFNDLDNLELISGAVLKSFVYNTTSCNVVDFFEWSTGRYNVTFINNDVNAGRILFTITLGKNGYANASATIGIDIISKATEAGFDIGYSPDIEIYYNQGITVGLLYWDSTLIEYIPQPDNITIVGNITVTFTNSSLGDTIIINIDPIGTLGYFYLNITMIDPGYAPQMLQIFITVNERTTYLDAYGETEVTDYASEDIPILFEYQDGIGGNNSILTATVTAEFALANSSLDINDYFDLISYTTVGVDYIQVTFDPNTAVTVGTTCIIELTFEEYGYVTKTIIIQLSFYPPVDYDMVVETVGELRQLDTFQFRVIIENATQELFPLQGNYPMHLAPNPNGDSVRVYYTFYFKDGHTEEYNETIVLSGSAGIYAGESGAIEIPWQVTGISYHALYIPSAGNEDVLVSKSTVESETIATGSAAFLALLTFLFREYTYYMVGGLAALAVIFIVLTIYFAVIRPKKQKKKATKRRYLDKISKILTSVLAMRKVIIVHQETGLPIYEWDLGGEITVDSSLVTGFLQAVAGMGSEISGGQAGTVRKLDYGQFVVSSSAKDCICAYLFSTSDVSVDVETGLSNFVVWFEKRFQTVLHDWNGITDEFQKNSHQIMDTLSEELFVWTLHPLSINPMKEKEVPKLSPLSQRIFKFIKDYKEVTISVALEYFNKTPIEETLSTLFNLSDEQFLLRKRLR